MSDTVTEPTNVSLLSVLSVVLQSLSSFLFFDQQ